MKIEEILNPGEVVIFNSKSNISDRKIKIFLMIIVILLDVLFFLYFRDLKDIALPNKMLCISLMFVMLVYAIYNIIMSYIVMNNNQAEYWITNLRVIVLQRDHTCITNDINILSAIEIIKVNKKNIGSILLYFGVEENFMKGIVASLYNTQKTDKIVLLNNVTDPIKAVKIMKNLNDETIIKDDKGLMPINEEDDE